MKQILFIFMVLIASVLGAEAQTNVKPYGSKGLYKITPTNDTITITPKYSASAYTMQVAQTVYLAVDTTASLPLNLVYLQLKADGTKRYVHFIGGFQAVPIKDSIAANKTKVYTFVTTTAGKFTLLGKSAEY